jgi:hypothetical protein
MAGWTRGHLTGYGVDAGFGDLVWALRESCGGICCLRRRRVNPLLLKAVNPDHRKVDGLYE